MCHNQQHNSQKLVQAAASLYFTKHQERPTTACILWSMSPRCAGGRRLSHRLRQRQLRVPEPREGGRGGGEVFTVFYSSFCCSFFWKHTGKMESTARTPSTAREFQDTASPAVVSLYSVVPALIATKDGGATPANQPGEHRRVSDDGYYQNKKHKKKRQTVLPRKVPMKKTPRGTLMTGEVMLMNQLGRKGVILRKMM